jgi:hypothetical protein
MTDEPLARIESKLDALTGTVETVAGTVATLVEGQAHLQRGQAKLEAGQAKLEVGQAKLGARVGALETGQDDLRRHMHVLHEDVIDKMRALDPGPLFATVRREIADAHEGVIRRLDLIELSVSELWKRQAPH